MGFGVLSGHMGAWSLAHGMVESDSWTDELCIYTTFWTIVYFEYAYWSHRSRWALSIATANSSVSRLKPRLMEMNATELDYQMPSPHVDTDSNVRLPIVDTQGSRAGLLMAVHTCPITLAISSLYNNVPRHDPLET